MATNFAALIAQSALAGADKGTDIASSLTQGAQLAQQQEQMQMQRERLEMEKTAISEAKLTKYGDLLITANNMKAGPAKTQFLNKFMPNWAKANGIDKLVPESTQEILRSSPPLVPLLQEKMRTEGWTLNKIISMPPEELFKLVPEAEAYMSAQEISGLVREGVGELATTGRETYLEGERAKRAEAVAASKAEEAGRKEIRDIRVAEAKADIEAKKQSDVDITKQYNKFIEAGGTATIDKKLSKLRRVREALASGKIKTGKSLSTIAGAAGGSNMLAILNAELKAAQDDIRSGISLKADLGGSFTAQEAQELYAMAFDPILDNKANIQKIDDVIAQLEGSVSAQYGLFESVPSLAPKVRKATPKAEPKLYTFAGKQYPRQQLVDLMNSTPNESTKKLINKILGGK